MPDLPKPQYPAGFSRQSVVVVTCADCLEPYGDDYTVVFASQEEAAKEIAAAGWWLVGDRVQCGACASRQACADMGHAWSEWSEMRDGTRVRYCLSLDPPICL